MKNFLLWLAVALLIAPSVSALNSLRHSEEFDAFGLHAAPLTGANASHVYDVFPELLQRPETQGKTRDACVDQICRACNWLRNPASLRLKHAGAIPTVTLTPWVISDGARIVALLEPEFLTDHTFVTTQVIPGSTVLETLKTNKMYRQVDRDSIRTFNTFRILLKNTADPINTAVFNLLMQQLVFPYISKPVAVVSPLEMSISSAIYGGAVFVQSEAVTTAYAAKMMRDDTLLTAIPTLENTVSFLLQEHLEVSYPFARSLKLKDIAEELHLYILDADSAKDVMPPQPSVKDAPEAALPDTVVGASSSSTVTTGAAEPTPPEAFTLSPPTSPVAAAATSAAPPPLRVPTSPTSGKPPRYPVPPKSPTSPTSPPPQGLTEIVRNAIVQKQEFHGFPVTDAVSYTGPDFDEDDDEEDDGSAVLKVVPNPWRETATGSPPPLERDMAPQTDMSERVLLTAEDLALENEVLAAMARGDLDPEPTTGSQKPSDTPQPTSDSTFDTWWLEQIREAHTRGGPAAEASAPPLMLKASIPGRDTPEDDVIATAPPVPLLDAELDAIFTRISALAHPSAPGKSLTELIDEISTNAPAQKSLAELIDEISANAPAQKSLVELIGVSANAPAPGAPVPEFAEFGALANNIATLEALIQAGQTKVQSPDSKMSMDAPDQDGAV